MILVLLGTNPYPFNRLTNAVFEWAKKNDEAVTIQTGNTRLSSNRVDVFPFANHSQIVDWIQQADVVICQGGFGSLQDCVKEGANIVAVPRKLSYGESVDDQSELVAALAAEGLVIPVYEIGYLTEAIDIARAGLSYKSSMKIMQKSVAHTINSLLGAE